MATKAKAVRPRVEKKKYDGPATELTRFAIEVIRGYHPVLKNQHVLTRYDNGQIRIQRADYITINPATNQIETQSFEVLFEEFVNHLWLWHFILTNPNKP